jgi:hypothetical protein
MDGSTLTTRSVSDSSVGNSDESSTENSDNFSEFSSNEEPPPILDDIPPASLAEDNRELMELMDFKKECQNEYKKLVKYGLVDFVNSDHACIKRIFELLPKRRFGLKLFEVFFYSEIPDFPFHLSDWENVKNIRFMAVSTLPNLPWSSMVALKEFWFSPNSRNFDLASLDNLIENFPPTVTSVYLGIYSDMDFDSIKTKFEELLLRIIRNPLKSLSIDDATQKWEPSPEFLKELQQHCSSIKKMTLGVTSSALLQIFGYSSTFENLEKLVISSDSHFSVADVIKIASERRRLKRLSVNSIHANTNDELRELLVFSKSHPILSKFKITHCGVLNSQGFEHFLTEVLDNSGRFIIGNYAWMPTAVPPQYIRSTENRAYYRYSPLFGYNFIF